MAGRRGVLWVGVLLCAAACGGARAVARAQPPLAPAPPLALGVDLHVHVTMHRALGLFRGHPTSGVLATSPGHILVNQLDVSGLRRAGIRLVVATVWPPPRLRPGRSALGEALHQLDLLRAYVEANPAFALAGSAAEARALLARGAIVLVPAVEGGEGITRPEDVDLLFAAGARSVTPVHFVDNALAGAADGQFGAPLRPLLDAAEPGLTPEGRAAVERMFQLGMLVDLAHASDAAMVGLLEAAGAAQVPVIFSHAGTGWTSPRNLSAPLARRMGQAGGLIGVGLFRLLLEQEVPQEERWEGFTPGTCDEQVAHWLHFARVAGPEAVVLGSDLNSLIFRPLPGGLCPDGVRHAGDLPALFAALVSRGLPRQVLDDSGERFLRLWEAAEARARPDARRRALRTPRPVEALFADPFAQRTRVP